MSTGGYLCNPVDHFPSLFGDNAFLKEYPYFLPCFVSSIGSLVGFVLGYFYLEESNPTVLLRKGGEEEEQPLLLAIEEEGIKHKHQHHTTQISKVSIICIVTYS